MTLLFTDDDTGDSAIWDYGGGADSNTIADSCGISIDYDGVDDYAELKSGGIIVGGTALTLECVFKITSQTEQATLLSQYNAAGTRQFSYRLSTTGELNLILRDDAANFTDVRTDTGVDYTDGVEHHASFAWSSANGPTAVLDGVEITDYVLSAENFATIFGTTIAPLRVGIRNSGVNKLTGITGRQRIYSEERTVAQMIAAYQDYLVCGVIESEGGILVPVAKKIISPSIGSIYS